MGPKTQNPKRQTWDLRTRSHLDRIQVPRPLSYVEPNSEDLESGTQDSYQLGHLATSTATVEAEIKDLRFIKVWERCAQIEDQNSGKTEEHKKENFITD